MKKKFTFWKAEKKADPTLNAKSVGLWLATVATTMVVTWLLAPAKKQECCKEAVGTEPKEKSKDEPAEEAKVDSVVESTDVSEAESEETPEEKPEEKSEGESTDESEEETSRIKKREEFIHGFKNPWKNKKAKRGEQRKE